MTRNLTRTLFILALVLATGAVGAQQPPGELEGSVTVGAWDASVEDSPDVAAEYESVDGGPVIDADLEALPSWGAFALDAEVRDDNDLVIDLILDLHRRWLTETTYVGHPHRLGRKSLDHFAAATNHGRVTEHTDLDPRAAFEIDYSVFEHTSEVRPKGLDNVAFIVGLRHQERTGLRQLTTVSHCSSCHVISQARPVDETTQDVSLEAVLTWKRGLARASFTSRRLENDPFSVSLLFDDALQPELLVPVFDNRLQWDSAEGPQEIDKTPDIRKDVVRLDTTFTDLGGFTLTVEGVSSVTENESTSLEADYQGLLVTAARAFDNGWRFGWRGRAYTLDNDDVFVDVNERLGIAGPQAGRTFGEIYGIAPDFLRRSALDRDALESRIDVSRRLGKRGNLRLHWDFRELDREHFEVAPGDGKTTENVLGVSWRARPRKGLKTSLQVRHAEIDRPFLYVDGAFSTLTSTPVSSPFDPRSAQYFESHEARIADTTAVPSSWDEIEARLSVTRGNSLLTGSYRWWQGDNDDGDLTDWSRTTQAATLTFWSAPRPSWEWQVAYSYNDNELDLPASIPLFDG